MPPCSAASTPAPGQSTSSALKTMIQFDVTAHLEKLPKRPNEGVELVVMQPMACVFEGRDAGVSEQRRLVGGIGGPALLAPAEQHRAGDGSPERGLVFG